MIFRGQKILNEALYNVEDFQELPSCGVEDVDRAIFELFSKVLPIYYEDNGTQKRIPQRVV